LKKYLITTVLLLTNFCIWAQIPTTIPAPTNPNAIKILNSDFIDKNQNEIPGAIVFTGNVQVEHNGVRINCNKAYHFLDENYVKAFGNVQINQGDTIVLNSRYAEYNGKTEFAFATGDVNMRSPDSNLVTDTVYFDKKIQQAYYRNYGTVTNAQNTLKSKSGRYYIQQKKYAFKTNVTVVNDKCTIKTKNLDFYDNSGHAYVYGPSTITSKNDYIYTENGFYDTKNDVGKLKNNSYITYDNKKIVGDVMDYDRKKNFSKAMNNVRIVDTLNKMVATGHYAEVYRNIGGIKKDSMFLTKKALIATLVEKDTMYLHGKRILVTGSTEDRTVRAFNNVRFYKKDMSGKCDSIHANNKSELTKLIGKPILWSNKSQMTGDEIHLIGNNKTEKIDSLKIINNAFLIQEDTIGKGYNQVKGVFLYGKLRDNKLYEVDMVKNTEKIYYMYDDKNELIGIDKGVSSSIHMELENNTIESITSITDPVSDSYPEEEYPENARKLRGFLWRGDEIINSKDDLFPEEEQKYGIKIIEETKKKNKEEKKPMDVLKQTTDYGKKDKKKKKEKRKKKKVKSKK
jgi:lipopolysaccharide export system protein LptA